MASGSVPLFVGESSLHRVGGHVVSPKFITSGAVFPSPCFYTFHEQVLGSG